MRFAPSGSINSDPNAIAILTNGAITRQIGFRTLSIRRTKDGSGKAVRKIRWKTALCSGGLNNPFHNCHVLKRFHLRVVSAILPLSTFLFFFYTSGYDEPTLHDANVTDSHPMGQTACVRAWLERIELSS